MQLKYKCLFLDHDDTSVDSTPVIHHPAHIEVIKTMRPGMMPLSLDDWFRKNFDPGIMAYMTDELGMDSREIAEEYEIWRKYTSGIVPDFFPGFIETCGLQGTWRKGCCGFPLGERPYRKGLQP